MTHCPACSRPFTRTPGFSIPTLPGMEMVPYCALCNDRLTLAVKKSYITSLANNLRGKLTETEVETAWAIALDTADYEHKTRRSK